VQQLPVRVGSDRVLARHGALVVRMEAELFAVVVQNHGCSEHLLQDPCCTRLASLRAGHDTVALGAEALDGLDPAHCIAPQRRNLAGSPLDTIADSGSERCRRHDQEPA